MITQLPPIKIFRVGTLTDSRGQVVDWSRSKLETIVSNFNNNIPPRVALKVGHSSAEYNEQIAKELGIPPSLIAGNQDFRSQASLGKVDKIELTQDGTLYGHLSVPEQVKGLIDNKYFDNVSCEMMTDYKGKGPIISALALLGAHRGAVDIANAVFTEYDGEIPDFLYSEEITFQTSQVTPITDAVKFLQVRKAAQFARYSEHNYVFGGLWGRVTSLVGSDERESSKVYSVPVNIEAKHADGYTERKVVVEHVRAGAPQDARNIISEAALGFARGIGEVTATAAGVVITTAALTLFLKYGVARSMPEVASAIRDAYANPVKNTFNAMKGMLRKANIRTSAADEASALNAVSEKQKEFEAVHAARRKAEADYQKLLEENRRVEAQTLENIRKENERKRQLQKQLDDERIEREREEKIQANKDRLEEEARNIRLETAAAVTNGLAKLGGTNMQDAVFAYYKVDIRKPGTDVQATLEDFARSGNFDRMENQKYLSQEKLKRYVDSKNPTAKQIDAWVKRELTRIRRQGPKR